MSMLSRFATLGGAPPDPYWVNVSYLLVGNGANNTTTNIVDSSSNNVPITVVGSAVISTGQSKYGSGSLYCPNSTSFIKSLSTTAGVFNTGNFTIEGWVYSTNTNNGYQALVCTRDANSQANAIFFGFDPSGKLILYTSSLIASSAGSASSNQWVYVTLVRASGTIYLFINGVLGGTASYSTTFTGSNLCVGNEYNTASVLSPTYFYDIRVTKGIARYTTNFTPPTAAMPTY